jgi:hypothetical protein
MVLKTSSQCCQCQSGSSDKPQDDARKPHKKLTIFVGGWGSKLMISFFFVRKKTVASVSILAVAGQIDSRQQQQQQSPKNVSFSSIFKAILVGGESSSINK